MADPASIVTFITLTSTCILGLLDFLALVKSHYDTLKVLFDDLQHLKTLLDSIENLAKSDPSSFNLLESPLENCRESCKGFLALIQKCTKRSSGARTSFIDVARLKLAEDDVADFKETLNGYKLTISLSLQYVTLVRDSANDKVRETFQNSVASVKSSLEIRICNLDKKMDDLRKSAADTPEIDTRRREKLLEDKYNAQQCIAICADIARLLRNSSSEIGANRRALRDPPSPTPAEKEASDAVHRCEDTMGKALSNLEKQVQSIDNRLQAIPNLLALPTILRTEYQTEARIRCLENLVKVCSEYGEIARCPVSIKGLRLADDNFHVAVNTNGGGLNVEDVEMGSKNRSIEGAMAPDSLHYVLQALTSSSRAQLSATNQPQEQSENSEVV